MAEPKLTAWEKLQLAAIEAHGLKRAAAGITEQPDIDSRRKRVMDRARKRAEGEKKPSK